MNKRNLKWMFYVIDRLLILEIGDPKRLESIKSKLKNSKTISEEDDQYLSEKLKDLKKLEPVSEPLPSKKIGLSAGKIIGLSILGIVMVGGAYLWITEIGPEIQRVTQLQEDRQNQPSYIERINEKYSSVEDCAGVSGASPPEIRDRCALVYRYSSP